MAQIISKAEYLSWKRDACTKQFFNTLDDNCKMIMNNWSNAAYALEDPVAGAVKNAEMLGQLRAFKSILEAYNENKLIPFSDELEEELKDA